MAKKKVKRVEKRKKEGKAKPRAKRKRCYRCVWIIIGVIVLAIIGYILSKGYVVYTEGYDVIIKDITTTPLADQQRFPNQEYLNYILENPTNETLKCKMSVTIEGKKPIVSSVTVKAYKEKESRTRATMPVGEAKIVIESNCGIKKSFFK